MTQRRCARECALEVLYRLDIGGEPVAKTVKEIIDKTNFTPEGRDFFKQLVESTNKHLLDIDNTIKMTLKHWSLERLSSVDRAILRVATGELLYATEVPPKVVINEALEIAKKFSGSESAHFINGVLDSIYKKRCG
ncbi:MAG: transcription antitermination factor NusB [Candidatus Latescibacteria bacterium]|nr:transcription antitermination factor NusB [Candidatus Latescibacterota bacterium]